MAKQLPRHYFEASAFIALLKREVIEEDQRWWHCAQLLEQAAKDESLIFTSGLTLAEVTGGKKSTGIHVPDGYKDAKEVVRAFFENEYIVIVEAGRIVGELARQLIWDFPMLDSFDATHLASALDAECDVLYTYDKDLLKIAGSTGNLHLAGHTEIRSLAARTDIRIQQPQWTQEVQQSLIQKGRP